VIRFSTPPQLKIESEKELSKLPNPDFDNWSKDNRYVQENYQKYLSCRASCGEMVAPKRIVREKQQEATNCKLLRIALTRVPPNSYDREDIQSDSHDTRNVVSTNNDRPLRQEEEGELSIDYLQKGPVIA